MKTIIASLLLASAAFSQAPQATETSKKPHAYFFLVDFHAVTALLGVPYTGQRDLLEVFVGGYPSGTPISIQTTYEESGRIQTHSETKIQGQYDSGVLIGVDDATKVKVLQINVNGYTLLHSASVLTSGSKVMRLERQAIQ